MGGRSFKDLIVGALALVAMLAVALGIVYLVQNVFDGFKSPTQVVESVANTDEVEVNYKDLVGTQGYKITLVRTDKARQQHYVNKVCVATGEIDSSYWVDFDKVDLGAIVN